MKSTKTFKTKWNSCVIWSKSIVRCALCRNDSQNLIEPSSVFLFLWISRLHKSLFGLLPNLNENFRWTTECTLVQFVFALCYFTPIYDDVFTVNCAAPFHQNASSSSSSSSMLLVLVHCLNIHESIGNCTTATTKAHNVKQARNHGLFFFAFLCPFLVCLVLFHLLFCSVLAFIRFLIFLLSLWVVSVPFFLCNFFFHQEYTQIFICTIFFHWISDNPYS